MRLYRFYVSDSNVYTVLKLDLPESQGHCFLSYWLSLSFLAASTSLTLISNFVVNL